ncbi:DUF4426 domain-containing protein [uncultured Lamprocystis sp.]|jgi:hypothetical protein|uniref:DUF4426 domain-containing protein n=1 Tax=uncultured Lamprocystis sp. TaxID=543132 RepID=UPI0025D55ACF|nr:DUF4426 domain-containing protein [uncultured Lamprocystis sp.]
MFKHIALAAFAAVTLMHGVLLAAEPMTRVGEFTIYHNAVNADTLSPEVAKAHKIERSHYRGVLNVSVIKDQVGTTGIPVKALVDVAIVDSADQSVRVPMHEIEERGFVSYIGAFPIADGQEITFDIKVRPVGVAEPTVVRMSQEFFYR